MSKFLPIINLALTAIVLIIMIVLFIQIGSIRSSIAPNGQEPKNENGEVGIPISQLEEVSIGAEAVDEQFILKLMNKDTGKSVNVILKVGVVLDTENKGAEASRNVLKSQGRIVRDHVFKILVSKDLEYYKDIEKQDEIKKEIVTKLQELIGNDAVVDVYFNNLIVSE